MSCEAIAELRVNLRHKEVRKHVTERNIVINTSRLSRYTVPCEWTGDRETTNGRLCSWDVKNAGGARPQLPTAWKS